MQSPLKGQPVKNVLLVEQYYPKPVTFMLEICSTLKEKVDLPRGPHLGIGFKFEFLGEFEFIFEKALGLESVGWGTCFVLKKTEEKISRDTVPLKNRKVGSKECQREDPCCSPLVFFQKRRHVASP
jgi:hypothetical protein